MERSTGKQGGKESLCGSEWEELQCPTKKGESVAARQLL